MAGAPITNFKIRILMQYVIDLRKDREEVRSQVKEVFTDAGVDYSDIEPKMETNRKGKLEVANDPLWPGSNILWLRYFIKKGFHIDCYTKYSSVYAGGEDVVIISKN